METRPGRIVFCCQALVPVYTEIGPRHNAGMLRCNDRQFLPVVYDMQKLDPAGYWRLDSRRISLVRETC